MLVRSLIFSEMRGSAGGLTISRNRGGQYARARVTPVNPNTSFQQDVRNALGGAQVEWRTVLLQAQRDAWDVYAENTGWLNKLGEIVHLTGLQEFIRQASPRPVAGLPIIPNAPIQFDRPVKAIDTVFGFDAALDLLDVTLSAFELWLSEDNAAMLCYVSPPQNATVNYYSGPYRLAGVIEGNSITPPAGAVTLPLPFPVAPGNNVFGYALISRADGRISTKQFFQGAAA